MKPLLKLSLLSFLLISFVVGLFFYLQPQPTPVSAQSAPSNTEWYMAGANPQRTSWVSNEVKGNLAAQWFVPFDAYIPKKIQPVVVDSTVYVSTAKGLYALDANNGSQKWVYPTAMSLGHSPTYYNGRLYVGGFDHKIHCINASNGQGIWTFEADRGFSTNPLVIIVGGKTMIYAGNRDNFMYALEDQGSSPRLAWRYQTQGPILFSAAASPDNATIYFASNDLYAYALGSSNGNLVWRSQQMTTSAGFHDYWPVVYHDRVIFPSSLPYRSLVAPANVGNFINDGQAGDLDILITRNTIIGQLGTEPYYWPSGTATMNSSTSNAGTVPVTEYLSQKPHRQTVFVLNRATGVKEEIPPLLYMGTQSMSIRYPSIVAGDDVIYDLSVFKGELVIPAGGIVGWKFGTPHVSLVESGWQAEDEPMAISAGGRVIYWTMKEYIGAGALDVSIANTNPQLILQNREWTYHRYDCTPGWMGCYNSNWNVAARQYDEGYNSLGVYGHHGTAGSPPIPYKNGKVFIRAANAIWAFTNVPRGSAVQLASTTNPGTPVNRPNLNLDQLKTMLNTEISKMVAVGHLLPGFIGSGLSDRSFAIHGTYFADYWCNPGDLIYTLLLARPYVSDSLRPQLDNYIQTEFNNYPPYRYAHIGWQTGVTRHPYPLPPEASNDRSGPQTQNSGLDAVAGISMLSIGYPFPVANFYALWKYAQTYNYTQAQAKTLFDTATNNTPIMSRFSSPPAATYLTQFPYIINSYITGYIGYLELQKMAGYPENTTIRNSLNNLLASRVANFNLTNFPEDAGWDYQHHLILGRNFFYLVPEFGNYLHDNALSTFSDGINSLTAVSPVWYQVLTLEGVGEGSIRPLFDSYGIFQAKAKILKNSREELLRYLDIPSATGDLYYIQNLVAVIQAEPEGPEPSTSPSPSTTPGCQSDINGDGTVNLGDIVAVLSSWGQSGGAGDLNGDGTVNLGDVVYILNFWGLACNP